MDGLSLVAGRRRFILDEPATAGRPRLLNRFPAIETRFPGATPEQVEILVTEPIEEAIREVPQVAIIESTSATGLSIVNVELDDSVTSDNQNEIIAQLREKLDSVVLPTQALAPDLSTDGGGAGAYTLVLGVQATQPYFDMIEMGRLSNQILDLVRQIPGTEYARLMGEPDERVWIEVNADRLADLGLGIGALANQVRQADINGASGVLRQGERNLTLNLQGGFDTVQRIADLPILVANGQSVTLGQIAHIRKGWKSPSIPWLGLMIFPPSILRRESIHGPVLTYGRRRRLAKHKPWLSYGIRIIS